MKTNGIENGEARLIKGQTTNGKNWVVEWVHQGLYQITNPLTRTDGKRFLKLLSCTLSGPFLHEVRGGSLQQFSINE